MIIKLNYLKIENFKGIKVFEMRFGGKNVHVFGTNATGKTTLVDAFQWLLFDKDSTGNSKFNIKPIDPRTEKEIHNLETSVEAVLKLDNNEITLKKVFKEKWVKQNGQTDREFAGHTTDYFIDGVKKRKTDYVNKVSEIVDEEVFKMITNVLYFNNLDWKKRRDIILTLCPDVSVEEVIKFKPDLKYIKDELIKYEANDLREMYRAELRKLNSKLEEIPIRIDELLKTDYSVLNSFDNEKANGQLQLLQSRLDEIRIAKNQDNSRAEILNLEAEIKNLMADKKMLENYKSDKQERLEAIITEGRKIKNEIEDLENRIARLSENNKAYEDNIQSLLENKNKLYKKYDEVQAQQFTNDKCAYCGQVLPQNKLDELLKQFNSQKVEKLEEIRNEGLRINDRIKEYQIKIQDAQAEIEKLTAQLNELKAQRELKLQEYEKVNSIHEANPNQEKINEINSKIAKLEVTISELKNKTSVNPFADEETKINREIERINYLLSLSKQKESTEARVAELEEEKKQVASAYSVTNNKLILCEAFIVAKAELLEKAISSNFEMVKFRLFEQQINGGITPTCVATVDGVPFSDVNNAKKVNAGLDIIKALQKVYEVKAPIFIDNAESVVKYLDMPDTQFIKLYVSEADKQLRFEIENIQEEIKKVA